ncbi:hypothetical protein F5X98DRAFT_333623 [Xylaria grammica]|nr:hypothetical protein F5X98DRAFT_333623 [Xylaria grammica]
MTRQKARGAPRSVSLVYSIHSFVRGLALPTDHVGRDLLTTPHGHRRKLPSHAESLGAHLQHPVQPRQPKQGTALFAALKRLEQVECYTHNTAAQKLKPCNSKYQGPTRKVQPYHPTVYLSRTTPPAPSPLRETRANRRALFLFLFLFSW